MRLLRRVAIVFTGAAALATTGALCPGGASRPAYAQDATTVRIGVIAPFSGPTAVYGQQFRRGIELALAEVDGRAGNARVEMVYRDEAPGPERSRQAAQELVVREKVRFLTGAVITPVALAIAPVANEAKVPFVILNAATGSITRRSPYVARFSHTQWQGAYTIGDWAARNGIKRAYVVVADYAPGTDAREGFRAAFTKGGGEVASELAVPLSATDLSPYVQRIKDARPEAVYVFMPVGPASISFMRAFASLGLPQDGVKLLGTGDTDDLDLPVIGDAALGAITAYHYGPLLDSPENRRFVDAYHARFGANEIPNFAAVVAYDAMHAMLAAIGKFGPTITGDQAMEVLRGWTAASPRGPIRIDAQERDIVQDIYIRRVERVGNRLGNVAFQTVPQVLDPWKALNPP